MKTETEIREEIETLEKKLDLLRKELNGKVGLVDIEWIGDVDRRKHGKPYLAVLTASNGKGKKYDFEFLDTVDEWYSKGRNVKSTYQGQLREGTVLKAREDGSWNNDGLYFYVVTTEGLKGIDEPECLKLLKILK